MGVNVIMCLRLNNSPGGQEGFHTRNTRPSQRLACSPLRAELHSYLVILHFTDVLTTTMPKSCHEVENRISEVYKAYMQRDMLQIKPSAQELNVPYNRLYSEFRIGRQSRSSRPTTKKAFDEAQE